MKQGSTENVLKIVMDDMQDGEVAAMYREGEDALILVARGLPDDVRCDAVNRLLATVAVNPPGRLRPLRIASAVAVLSLLAHLGEQVAGPAGQGLQALLV